MAGVFERLKGSGGNSSGAVSNNDGIGVFRRIKMLQDYDAVEANRIRNYETTERNEVKDKGITNGTVPAVNKSIPTRRGNIIQNDRQNYRPAVIDGRVEDYGPGVGEVVGKSLLTGMNQANMAALNVPRMIHKGISNVWDAITPDFIYKSKEDPLTKVLDRGVEHFEKQAEETRQSLGELKGFKNFLNTGLESLPTMIMAGVAGAGVGGAAGGLGQSSKLAPEIARMIPFGAIAGGGYARDAEKEGASYTQQVLYGTMSGLAEMVTETPVVEGVLDTISKLGAGELIEQGAKNIIGKYGKAGLSWLSNILKEGLQEAVIEPITGTIRKMTYDRNMPIYGEGGVIDPKQMGSALYGGVAMSVILGALGLPAYAASRRYVENKIETGQPLDNKAIEEAKALMSQDIDNMEAKPSVSGGVFARLKNETNAEDNQDKNIPSNSSTKPPRNLDTDMGEVSTLPNQQEAEKRPFQNTEDNIPQSHIQSVNNQIPSNESITLQQSETHAEDLNQQELPSQFQGKTPESEKVGIVPPEMRDYTSMDKEFTYSDPELEKQHIENRLSKKTHIEKIKEWSDLFKRQFTRVFKDIEPTTENAEAMKELVRYPKIKAITADEAARVIRDIIDREGSSLSNEEYNRFERYVFLKDLMEEIEKEHTLPGLWTEDNVKHEYERVKNSLNDNILKAVERREQHMERIKKDYIKAMADIGFNVEDRFTRRNYFRHQVLEYMNAKKITGSGSRVKVNKNRGFLKKREGTHMAINEDYLQAEYEVLSNMLNDMETAKMLARIEKRYSIKEKLKKKANLLNEEALQDIIKSEKEKNETSETEATLKEFNKNIAIGFGRLQKLAMGGQLWDGDGKYAAAIDSIKNGTRNVTDGGRVFNYLSQLVDQQDTPGQLDAALILKNVSNRKKFIQTILGKNYVTWENIIPEGYTTWQPIIGKTFFSANSITDKLVEALMEENFKNLGVSDLKVRKILAIGQNLKEYVIPEGIAKTLDNVYNSTVKDENAVSKIVSVPLKYWKGWVLTGNPRQVIKYNIRNITGDLDGLIASGGFGSINPKYVSRATKELYDAMKYMNFTPDLLEWRDKGGFQSLLYANEIAEVNDLQIFRKYNKEAKASVLSKIIPIPNTYFEFTRNLTDYREGLMRYASYLYFKDQIKANGGKPKSYGASNPKIIDGLKSIEDKAYQLSKDALGAYDEITEFGQAMRKYLIPFYSWNEVNFKRYKRIVENAVNDIKLQQTAGEKVKKSLGLSGYISAKTMLQLGKIAIRIGAMSAVLLAWNNLVMHDEEEELPENIRSSPHITLGRNDKGEVIYFSRLGALNDLLEWFGLDTLAQDVKDLKLGRKTIREQVSDMVISPINKLVSGLTPFLKNPAEILAGQSYYPDIREPRRIRDKEEYIASSLGVGEEYKRLKGLPVNESYLESWYKAFIYKSEPEKTAYYRMLDLKAKFQEKVLKQAPSYGYSDSEKSKDLYYFKLSLKYGDKKAAEKYLKKYFEDGGTTKGLATSLNTMSPIYGLDDEELKLFISWLTPEEQKDLKKALKFYGDLVGE